MNKKTLIFGKYIAPACILLFAPICLLLILPSIFATSEIIQRDNTGESELLPSNSASLSASLRLEVIDFLPTDQKTLRVETNNVNGYRVFEEEDGERKILSVVPEYAEPKATIADIDYMQEMTPEICEATPTPRALLSNGDLNTEVPEAILVDKRDGSSYAVRKLADGKCWMAQNLRLNLRAGKGLGAEDTDVAEGTLFVPGESTATTSGERWGSSQPSEEEVNQAHSYSSGNNDYGNYYNWYAATAGSGVYYMSEESASASICPKGWKLPASDGKDSFLNLLDVYEIEDGTKDFSFLDILTGYPIGFALAGDYYYNGVVGGQGEWADYWTADAENLVAASFDVENGQMNYNQKTAGLSVRCVAK